MTSDFDVIVAGGGPAGSTAARECASAGLTVGLLDKAEFPRDKPCGGGVTIRCAKQLPFDLSAVSERDVTGVRFSAPGVSIGRWSQSPLTYMTQRINLDGFLIEKAQQAGVSVMQRMAVRGVKTGREGYVITAGGREIRCRYLVAADGANGVTARLAGIDVPRWKGIALEGNVHADPLPERWRSTIGVDFSHIRGGYGWIFPKGDHVNIGLGGWRDSGPALRSRLAALTRSYGFEAEALRNLRGYPLPVRQPGAPIARDRLLLIGDAAGLLDPFTGEGIFAAIWSGRAAARKIVEDMVDGRSDAGSRYVEDVQAHLLPDLRVSRKLAGLFHLAPWAWTHGMRVPAVSRLAFRLLTGEQTYSQTSKDSRVASSLLATSYEALKLVSWTRGRGANMPLLFAA